MNRRQRIGLAVAVVVAIAWLAGSGRQTWDRATILAAIRAVESGGRDDPPDGDDGRAIGPYQIHREYWADATAFESSLIGDYEDCRGRSYAERVIDAYMRRWVPDAWSDGDGETIARVHNGGPLGHEAATTLGYWSKVLAALDRRAGD